ncbi:alkylated DNA repair protein alkB homolog 8 isoform X2 [Selaginella moellendorffii]|uniref:alkylated DNA repair protein alkB homolog 8 isoform X2 n=1 Tax=Selaginella moellendorffii TaxID=88036 RepID=UPI000D1D0592|nr:alkylated DNA repair protein alkB homolog 8 isoform X2 [Selaginella moellendorffii]|eukprot:XP_024525489.1 alkylated DNA repair protein alkB homolog 8 isoform X2 [Selaginella moellendorffii]
MRPTSKVAPKKRALKKSSSRASPQQQRLVNTGASSFVECPACQLKVATTLINVHLDLDCKPARNASQKQTPLTGREETICLDEQASCSSVFVALSSSRVQPKPSVMNGYQLVENFISCEESLEALQFHWLKQWQVLRPCDGSRQKINAFVHRKILAPKFEMPHVLEPIMERMRSIPLLAEFFPNEMNSLEYIRESGHFLRPHVDDRQLSGTLIVNLSMCGECYMTFKRERGAYECHKIRLKQRSLQILTGDSRYNFTHEIENRDLLSPRRVSITFREVIS